MTKSSPQPALSQKNIPKANIRPLVLSPFFRSIRSIKGIGPKQAPLLENFLGPFIKNLLFHLPSGLLSREFAPCLEQAENGRTTTLIVEVINHIPSFRRGAPYKVRCKDEKGDLIDLVFFHARKPYLIKLLPLNEKKLISGRVDFFHGYAQMVHPDFIGSPSQKVDLSEREAIYPLTHGINNKTILQSVKLALKEIPPLEEWISPSLLKRESWDGFYTSLYNVHHPKTQEVLSSQSPERRRLAYDEILSTQLALALVRYHQREKSGFPIPLSTKLKKTLLENLPYTLTQDQQKSIHEIEHDISSQKQMLRLLQGDVGSGKTIVAFICALHYLEQGKQVVLMAPTEILARQHFENAQMLLSPLGIHCTLLTGSEKGKKRQEIYTEIESGKAQFIFGTHALFQDRVKFKELSFAVIDEQHRFGVHQRLMLSDKGQKTDILVMTATPIPRTLTLTFYGDMDVSRIQEKPKNRLEIDTKAISLERIEEIVTRLKQQVEKQEKIYWVCPLVEESEKLDLAAAEERYQYLAQRLGKEKIALIHGRMKADEKQKAMEDFKNGNVHILVSTTVIEVGVDVPDATVIIIEHAERFGLSQLHQLRGRVGRGSKQSHCLLLYSPHLGNTAKQRLEVMKQSNDGFIIAEKDLILRGAGEILGTRQSGLAHYQLAQIDEHQDLISIASDDAKYIIKNDPFLKTPRGEALRYLLYLFERDKAISYLRSG